MTDPDTIRAAIDALGGCEEAGALMNTNARTVRRWYSGARPPGAASVNRMRTLLAGHAVAMQNILEDIT